MTTSGKRPITNGQRIGVLIGVIGAVALVVLMLLPFKTHTHYTADVVQNNCSSTFTYWHRASPTVTDISRRGVSRDVAAVIRQGDTCYSAARSRAHLAFLVGGALGVIGAVVFYLYRRREDAPDSTTPKGTTSAELR
jgi:hypothetical protein